MKFLDFLNEAVKSVFPEDFTGTIIKAVRTSKLNKKGETSLGYTLKADDKKLDVLRYEYNTRHFYLIKLKSEKFEAEHPYFEKDDKKEVDAFYNSKIYVDGNDSNYKLNGKITVSELLSEFNSKDNRVVISSKANKYLETTIDTSDEDDEDDTELFAIGYWSNPYGRTVDREYFWLGNSHGDYESKKDILAAANRKCKNGQPTRFKDYMSGSAKAFDTRAKFLAYAEKVGLNPNLKDY